MPSVKHWSKRSLHASLLQRGSVLDRKRATVISMLVKRLIWLTEVNEGTRKGPFLVGFNRRGRAHLNRLELRPVGRVNYIRARPGSEEVKRGSLLSSPTSLLGHSASGLPKHLTKVVLELVYVFPQVSFGCQSLWYRKDRKIRRVNFTELRPV